MRKQNYHSSLFTLLFLWEQHLLSFRHVIGTSSHNLVTHIQTTGDDEVLTVAGIFCCHVDSSSRTVSLHLLMN